MQSWFDDYALKARMLPAALVVAPLGFFLSAFADNIVHKLAMGVLPTAALAMFVTQIVRDLGNKAQMRLYKQWGGVPTTILLRHRDSALPLSQKVAIHRKLKALLPDCTWPSINDESVDQDTADQIYASAVDILRERHRNLADSKLLQAENIAYGFRRNLLGLKRIGIIITFLVVVAGFVLMWGKLKTPVSYDPRSMEFAILYAAITHVGHQLVVTSNWVRSAADRYAKALLMRALA